MAIASFAALAGVFIAYLVYLRRVRAATILDTSAVQRLHRFWLAGWGFDWLYDRVLVRPFLWFAQLNRDDAVDAVYDGVAFSSRVSHAYLSRTQTGRVRWYAGWLVAGSLAAIAIAVFA